MLSYEMKDGACAEIASSDMERVTRKPPAGGETSDASDDLSQHAHPNGAQVRRSSQIEPRTELGRKLIAIRRRIEESGEPLLDWDGLERELAERRGGVGYDE